MDERRGEEGFGAVSRRANELKQRLVAAHLPARVLLVQDGLTWPELRPPILLDTYEMSDFDLLVLLVHTPPAPIFVLADPARRRVLTLLALTRPVRFVCADVPALAQWVPYLDTAMNSPRPTPLWLIPNPFVPKLDPLFIPMLAALWQSPSYAATAAICGLSESSISRVLRSSRAALHLPAGDSARYRPVELAAIMFDRLADDLSLPRSTYTSARLSTS